MAYLNDLVFDSGLAYATTNGTRMDICSGEPANYAAIAGVTLGNDTVTTGSATDATSGRKVIVPAISAGSVTGTGTALFWALNNGSSILVATGPVASQAVTSGNTFTLNAQEINLLDASAV